MADETKRETMRQFNLKLYPQDIERFNEILDSMENVNTKGQAISVLMDFWENPKSVIKDNPALTQRIAKAIDTGFNFVASNFIAKDSGNEYKADKDDLADLGEAWGELAEEKQWEMSPVWQVLLLSALVYIPLAKQAFNDRRIMELERKQAEQEQRQQSQEERIKELENELYRRNEAERKSPAAFLHLRDALLHLRHH